MTAYESAEWAELFAATAGAAAALTGLVFVAVSINVDRILKYEGLPERALATMLLLLGVVIVSMIGLVPGQGQLALGAELVGIGLAGAAATNRLSLRARSDPEAPAPTANAIVMAAGTLPFVAGGASLMLGAGGGLYWVVAGMALALVGAVLNAWVFLVEILR